MRATASGRGAAPAGRCAHCAHRDADPGRVERTVAGIVVLSSGYGSSLADSRLCTEHDQFVSPDDSCSAFASKHVIRPV